jgi:hypothetical protein
VVDLLLNIWAACAFASWGLYSLFLIVAYCRGMTPGLYDVACKVFLSLGFSFLMWPLIAYTAVLEIRAILFQSAPTTED